MLEPYWLRTELKADIGAELSSVTSCTEGSKLTMYESSAGIVARSPTSAFMIVSTLFLVMVAATTCERTPRDPARLRI
jgi:hypothetical protein